jgi:hypothetical protein
MKLWIIKQNMNNDYDTYSDAVVCADTEEEARLIHPNGYDDWDGTDNTFSTWCGYKDVVVEYIGEAKEGLKKGVVCASFHAG